MPPFFIPIIAFVVWMFILFTVLPVLRLNLYLGDQLLAPQLFISHLILISAWALSGPLTVMILTALSTAAVFYLCLSAKEPAFFLQIAIYWTLFIGMVFYLYEVQQKAGQKNLSIEKLEEDLHLLSQDVVKNERLREALQAKIARLLDMQRFSEELKSLPNVHETANKIVHEAMDFIASADECALYLVDEAKQELRLAASTRDERPSASPANVFDRWVMKRCQAIMIEDTRNDFRFSTEKEPDADRLRSVCASPLMTENKVLAVLHAGSARTSAFTSDDLRLLDILSSIGAVTLKNLLLYERMGELAIRDSLTGLYLNRYFMQRLDEEILMARRGGGEFALVLLDIDHFKQYNDEFGHSAGDLVLKTIASIVQKNVNSDGLAARYGGEEFVLLLSRKTLAEAVKFAESLRKQIEKHVFVLRREEGHVTASFGVTAFPDGGENAVELLSMADKLLYKAKRSGRNRVCGDT